ncbi:MAG: HNH endonuclease family protein [Gordonia sp. (in: high G+C Gram-positive bacteria)]|uniref:HNH endonuclease family protein n=1 Tax=Gordonia sp. (in: high G+C Gram-positive bacteria) TaxID=84139 RepID=UPI0039E38231
MRWTDLRGRLRTWEKRNRGGCARLPMRHWLWATGFSGTAVLVAVTAGWPAGSETVIDPARVTHARTALVSLTVLPARPPHDEAYSREAFGQAWTDTAPVAGAGNGCDTRNDVLARDLSVNGAVAVTSCREAVASGRFRSPYTGREIVFTRGRGSTAVQIDHIVPLSYAWDMGASAWPPQQRTAFANDPANLLATDAASNQAKSDLEPGRWMPELRGFWCQYAIQFIDVADAYRLSVDEASRRVLATALGEC